MGGQLAAVCIIIINECHVKIFLWSRTALNQFTVNRQPLPFFACAPVSVLTWRL